MFADRQETTKTTTMESTHMHRQPGRTYARWMRRLLAVVTVAVALVAVPSAASGAEIESFSAGLSSLQAGGHANARTSFRFKTELASGQAGIDGCLGGPCRIITGGAPKDIVVDLPRGLLGNPQAAQRCTVAELAIYTCPVASQVGYMDLTVLLSGNPWGPFSTAIYNMEPERGEVAKFGFRAINGVFNSFISFTLRDDGDYAIRTTVGNVFDGNPVLAVDLTIWGVPGDPSNDPQRACFAR